MTSRRALGRWVLASGLALGLAGGGAAPAGAGSCAEPPECPAEPPECPLDDGTLLRVELDTTFGTIPIGLLPDVTPLTVENFLAYLESGHYDQTLFHRSIPGFVIQGGGIRYTDGDFSAEPTECPVCNEPCRPNQTGTIAMAKFSGDPNSATAQWFINLADNENLDDQNGGFTVFGRVLDDGMDVVNAIAALPTVDGDFTLSTLLRSALTNLPVREPPVEDPKGYGCFDLEQVGALVVQDDVVFERDEGGNLIFTSWACDETAPTNEDRVVGIYNVDEQDFLRVPPGSPLIGTRNITQQGVDASAPSLAARWADLEPQVVTELVELTQARVVPEPASAALQLATLCALGWLAHRRRG